MATLILPGAAVALLATSAMADYSSTVLSYSPLGYWKLNETNAPTADFATNSGTLGTKANGYYTSGSEHPVGGAIVAESSDTAAYFPDVSGNRVTIPWITNLAYAGPFSVEFWASPADVKSGDSATMCPVSFTQFGEPAGAGDGTRKGWLFYQNGATGWTFRTYGNGNAGSSATDTVTVNNPGAWYHVVGVYDGTNTILYVNGAQKASVAAASFVPVPENRAPFSVGARGYGSAGFFRYNGAVDEVAFYTNALSLTEITSHYQNGLSSAPATPYEQLVSAKSPLVYLRFNEPSYTAVDETAQPVATNYGSLGTDGDGHYHSTAHPGAVGAPFTGIAQPNLAPVFSPDADDSYVSIGTSEGFNFIGVPFSVSLWFKTLNTGDVRFQTFMGKGDKSWRGGVDGDGHLRFAYGTNPDVIGSTVVRDGKWHHYVGVYDGSSTLTMYLDGIVEGTVSATAVPSGSTSPLLFGSVGDYANGRTFKGSLDEIAVYDKALTVAQVGTLFASANVAPTIAKLPSDLSGIEGTSLSYTATLAGTTPFTYQWLKNGTNVSGATSATLNFPSLLASDSGTYTLVAANAYGSTTSSVVTLAVTYGPPVITNEVANIGLYVGRDLKIPVAISGSFPRTYQWYLNGSILSGQNAATLNLTGVNAVKTGEYSLVVTNPRGSISNVIAHVTLVPAPTASYPATVLADNPLAFYRLDESSGSVAYDYAGGFNGHYINVTLGQPGYSVTDTDTAALFTLPAPSYIDLGSGIDFSSSTNRPFSIEVWVKGGEQGGDVGILTKGEGAGGEQFNLDTGNGGAFRFFYREAGGGTKAVNSNVKPDGAWHHIVAVVDPVDGVVRLFIDNNLEGDAQIGTGVLSSTHAVTVGARQSGSTAYDLQFSGILDEVAFYDKALSPDQVTAHYAARYSGAAAPAIRAQPASLTNYVNLTAVFTVEADGPDLTYQWQYNGVDIAGATGSSYTNSAITSANAGSYRVIVSNASGSVTSQVAVLTVLTTAPTSLNIASDLVLHLPFDGNYADISGRTNDGTKVGSPSFVTGKIGGSALHYSTVNASGSYNYVTLGKVSDLNFSSNVNFSVSFWVQLPAGSLPQDLPFFTDTTNSTFSTGFTFAPSWEKGGWAFSVNGTGMYGPDASINDGNWHHLAYTFNRNGNALAYMDGVLVANKLISNVGDIAHDSVAVIGQDATGRYGANGTDISGAVDGEASIDDLGVWRRVLTPFEISSIFYGGSKNGISFAPKVVPVSLSVAISGAQVKLTYTGGVLQSADTVNGTYTTVSGATSPYLVTPTPTTATKFYRVLVQ